MTSRVKTECGQSTAVGSQQMLVSWMLSQTVPCCGERPIGFQEVSVVCTGERGSRISLCCTDGFM